MTDNKFTNDPNFGSFTKIYDNYQDKENSPYEWGVRLSFASPEGTIFENVPVKTTKNKVFNQKKIQVVFSTEATEKYGEFSICRIVKDPPVSATPVGNLPGWAQKGKPGDTAQELPRARVVSDNPVGNDKVPF